MPTITRQQFADALKNKEVSLDDLKPKIDARVHQKLKQQDADGNGKLSGAEVGKTFKALDDFDLNGTRESLGNSRRDGSLSSGYKAAQQLMSSARPSSREPPMPPDPGSRPSPSGPASRVDADSTMRNLAGGSGNIKVKNGPDGKPAAMQFKADMDVDTDGGTSALARSDPHYQSQTSMQWAGRKSLDASKLSFIVLPPQVARATGAKLGDLVEVEQNGKKQYAIYADNGPRSKIGEASLKMAQDFDSRAGPNRAAAGMFTYTVLPGSGAREGIRNGGPAKSEAEIQAAGARAFADARARGLIS